MTSEDTADGEDSVLYLSYLQSVQNTGSAVTICSYVYYTFSKFIIESKPAV
jgi:hypothetical protein